MTSARSKYGSQERAAAIRMHMAGAGARTIAAELNIPKTTVENWIYVKQDTDKTREVVVKRKTSSGSGVIAPKPYRTGYVYGAGW